MKFTKKEMETLIASQSKITSGTIEKTYTYYPHYNGEKFVLGTALVMELSKDDENYISVLLATGSEEWSVHCGDKFLDGCMEITEVDEAIIEVVSNIPKKNKEMIRNALMNSYDSMKKTSGCTNNRLMANINIKKDRGEDFETIASGDSVVCSHIQNMFAQMNAFEDEARVLLKMLKDATKVSRLAETDNEIVDKLNNYGFSGEAMFIAGPGGHGKTHTVTEFVEHNKIEFVELKGHGQIEAIDMYGYDKKVGDQLVWFDGPVSQAARLAASGKKTILFIDEFTNIPMRETAGLKASFEPYKGHYYFQTGRVSSIVDGIGVMENIKVPVENLQIIVAANIGSGYASEDIDKALIQRFMVTHYEAADEKVRKVLKSICVEKGFNVSLVEKLMSFKKLLEIKKADGELSEAPTMRHLSRKFLGLMKSEDELEDIAYAQILQFVEFNVDGTPVAEQVEIVEEAIETTLI